MGTIGIIALLIMVSIMLAYAGFITLGYDNFRGITIQLDKVYKNTAEMASATFEELKKQGKECEIIEMGEGYPKFIVDGKKYVMVPRVG